MAYDPAALRCVPGDTRSLVRIVRSYRQMHDAQDLAARMADARKSHHLLPLFEQVPERRDSWAEFLACLAQELLLRGVRWSDRPVVMECIRSLRQLRHPLAFLPTKLTRTERRATPPALSCTSSTMWRSCPPPGGFIPKSPPEAGRHLIKSPIPCRDTATAEQVAAIGAVVKHWNGSPQVLLLQAAEPLTVDELVPVGANRCLPDGCGTARGALRDSGRELGAGVRTELHRVFEILLDATYREGSYDRGIGGAYGRAAVWRSVAGMIRAPLDTPIERVNELAARWNWFCFDRPERSQDFDDLHLAVGALSPRGRHLSLLISHDTD
ncbi:DUF6183 family protein [Streptomyces sp. H51]|uniref:DUF6183 family protein n=1 Tax=Streptomyces sp. H51 TaxID=3111770 RepID=UPI002D77DC58|nr:DUF6183 family protein [Streptomyces sp. H51]